MSRSTIIREVENDLSLARARGMLKQPHCPGETMAEYRERKAYRMKVYKTLTIGFAVLLLVAVAMWAGVQR